MASESHLRSRSDYANGEPQCPSEYIEALETFENEMDPEGPFFFGNELGWVDILIAPCKHIQKQKPGSLD